MLEQMKVPVGPKSNSQIPKILNLKWEKTKNKNKEKTHIQIQN